MTEPANAHCFSQPHWRIMAQGLRMETWFNDGQAVGTGGILNPKRVHLRSGNFYYRFASSNSSREAKLGSGWWLDFENYRKVELFAQENNYSIRDAARLMLALPYDWTRVDLKIKALLAVPLDAYAGEGKPAQGSAHGADRGTKWIPTQHIKICQLYIPGLYIPGDQNPEVRRKREQLHERVFTVPIIESLM